MIDLKSLPKLLGDQFDPGAEYAMTESHASARAGRFPSPRKGKGHWRHLGEFSDPQIDSKKTFNLYVWRPHLPTPSGLGTLPLKESSS